MSEHERQRRLRLAGALLLVGLLAGLAGLTAGSEGWSLASLTDPEQALIVWQIRAPRTLGAWLVGAPIIGIIETTWSDT